MKHYRVDEKIITKKEFLSNTNTFFDDTQEIFIPDFYSIR